MSRVDILYAVLFVALFPGLWGLASFLDHVWPSNYERRHGRRGPERPHS